MSAAPSADRVAALRSGRLRMDFSFDERVWALTARIPPGRVTTYGAVAAALGTRAARAVGGALGRNPLAPDVPCHRVIGSDRRLGGFSGGLAAKRARLVAESVPFEGGRVAPRAMVCPGPAPWR